MSKSILVATVMAAAFTFVSIGTVTLTTDKAFAGKKKKSNGKQKKVSRKKGNRLFESCAMAGGSFRVSSSGRNIRCRKNKKSITCPYMRRKGGCNVKQRR